MAKRKLQPTWLYPGEELADKRHRELMTAVGNCTGHMFALLQTTEREVLFLRATLQRVLNRLERKKRRR